MSAGVEVLLVKEQALTEAVTQCASALCDAIQEAAFEGTPVNAGVLWAALRRVAGEDTRTLLTVLGPHVYSGVKSEGQEGVG